MVAIALMYVLFIVINTTITRSLDMFHVSRAQQHGVVPLPSA
jgi:hypothetical protein